jgi:hypothetical protein
MLAKSLKKIAIKPTALVPVMTKMWRAIEPLTKRGCRTGAGSEMSAGGVAEAGMGGLSMVRAPLATAKSSACTDCRRRCDERARPCVDKPRA